MKYYLLLFFCLPGYVAIAQKLPDFDMNKVRITLPDKIIVTGIEPTVSSIASKPKAFYYWYSAGAVHQTQGGYSGKLLDGQYSEYYPDRNLKQQGNFKKGLKVGLWKNWADDGTLLSISRWKHGTERPVKRPPIWKRVHWFKKKNKSADTLGSKKPPIMAPAKTGH
jgi:hypothetical protein